MPEEPKVIFVVGDLTDADLVALRVLAERVAGVGVAMIEFQRAAGEAAEVFRDRFAALPKLELPAAPEREERRKDWDARGRRWFRR